MGTRDRSLRKLSGIIPDSPEFTILVKKSQAYKQAIGESVRLVELLRISHQKNIELRQRLYEANMTLFQLKLAAVGAISDVAIQNVQAAEAVGSKYAYSSEGESSVIAVGIEIENSPATRPEERPASPAAEH